MTDVFDWSMVDQSRCVDNRLLTKANESVVGNYASKYVNVFEIVKINWRIFEFESDFCMAGLLILENMVIWPEIEGYIGF